MVGGYKIYRERRLPDGTISCSIVVDWQDGICSHEEVVIPEDADDQEVKRIIRDTLKDWKQKRPNRRLSGYVKAERAKEYGKTESDEEALE